MPPYEEPGSSRQSRSGETAGRQAHLRAASAQANREAAARRAAEAQVAAHAQNSRRPASAPVQNRGQTAAQRAPVRSAQPARPAAQRTAQARAGSGTVSARTGVVPAQSRRAASAKKSKKRSKGKAPIAILCVLALVVGGLFAFYQVLNARINGRSSGAGTINQGLATLPEFRGDYINLLVCGIDYDNEDADGYTTPDKIGRTDMILYVHYDVKANKAMVLQMPRDVYVGDEVETGNTYKINALYYYAPDPKNRMNALASVFYNQYGLTVDAYITIDMDALKEIVDILGPIEVYVPSDINDNRGNVLQQGMRSLSAEDVEFLVRNRYSSSYNDQGDIARLQTQKHFYAALFRRFTALTPTDLWNLFPVFTYRCKTNMDLMELTSLAMKALKLTASDVTFVRPACGGADYNGNIILSLDPTGFAGLLNRYFRTEGQQMDVSELNIPTLTVDERYGWYEADVTTMTDIEASEGQSLS